MYCDVKFLNGSIHRCELIARRNGIAIIKFQNRVFSIPCKDLVTMV